MDLFALLARKTRGKGSGPYLMEAEGIAVPDDPVNRTFADAKADVHVCRSARRNKNIGTKASGFESC
ncbi:MAG: hypothetical protein ABJM43_11700 [Paracoccaceae bacterium]